MILLISPAKTLDFSEVETNNYTTPRLIEKSQGLIDVLKNKNASDIQHLMGVSEKIAILNEERFKTFRRPFTTKNAKIATLAFKGDVYTGLQAETFSSEEMQFAQKKLRILSGLYGLLKPLDLMQPYRLEMGTKLSVNGYKNLYQFWSDEITNLINTDLEDSGSQFIVNLASKEYFKSVNKSILKGDLYEISFKENRNGVYKVISFSAKKARGLMCRYVIQNRLTEPMALKQFDWEDYRFNGDLSSDKNFVFTR